MPKNDELSRFSVNGKTFFFNRGRASNDSLYLAINALYGKGNQERLVLFRDHMFPFHEHLTGAVGEFWDFRPARAEVGKECPDCGAPSEDWRVTTTADGSAWVIYCTECDELIFENVEDAYETIQGEISE